jgi:hypothetical protein
VDHGRRDPGLVGGGGTGCRPLGRRDKLAFGLADRDPEAFREDDDIADVEPGDLSAGRPRGPGFRNSISHSPRFVEEPPEMGRGEGLGVGPP